MTPQATHLPPGPRDRGLQPRPETLEGPRRKATTSTTAIAPTTGETAPPPPQMQHTSSGGSDWTAGGRGGGGGGGKPGGGGGGGGEGGGGRKLDSRFSSWTSFGSVTQDRPTGVGASAWSGSVSKGGRCCCSCVPLPCGPQVGGASPEAGQAGHPETYEGGGGGGGGSDDGGGSGVGSADSGSDPRRPVMGAGVQRRPGFTGKSGFRPRHRRGHSAGSTRIARVAQPQGWEIAGAGAGSGGSGTTVAASTATSTTSSNASAALAAAAAAGTGDGGAEGGREVVLSWGRRSGSWGAGGVAAADREFHRILKAGVDVFKHSSTRESGQWAGVFPRRLKELLSKSCPLDDENQGLVTLFLDKERENLCWCPPGAAELVPDERYRLSARSLAEVIPGDEPNPRVLTLWTTGRPNPLVFELDSDELYDIVSKGILRILERNHIRDMADPRNVNAI